MILSELRVKPNVKLDFLHIEEASPNVDDIFLTERYKPTLHQTSKFLATFDDGTTIEKGLDTVALGYTFSVYKGVKNSNKLELVARISSGDLSILDYNIKNDTSYVYYIFKEDDDVMSQAVVTNEVSTCWWDWSLVDLYPDVNKKNTYYTLPDTIWKFNLNVNSGSVNQRTSVTVYDNLSRFPVVSTGNTNYAEGSLTCLLGDVKKVGSGNIEYVESPNMLDEWREFCANGRMKLLRDRKGNAMIVNISNSSSQLDDILREQVNTITFTWTEVADTNNAVIIGV